MALGKHPPDILQSHRPLDGTGVVHEGTECGFLRVQRG
jgi:hypothetical protein